MRPFVLDLHKKLIRNVFFMLFAGCRLSSYTYAICYQSISYISYISPTKLAGRRNHCYNLSHNVLFLLPRGSGIWSKWKTFPLSYILSTFSDVCHNMIPSWVWAAIVLTNYMNKCIYIPLLINSILKPQVVLPHQQRSPRHFATLSCQVFKPSDSIYQ